MFIVISTMLIFICIVDKISHPPVYSLDSLPPSAYVERMAGIPVRHLPGMDLTPVSTNLFNSDFNWTLNSAMSPSNGDTSTTTSSELDPFDASFTNASKLECR